MTNAKSTKKSLVASLIVLCLCFASLIGTTFAWFTDEVNSTGNVIKTGTLDVEMYWAEGTEDPANATWNDASAGAIFTNDKWEPGYTVAKHLKIENKGTLAFNYKLAIIPHGEVSKLADVIEVYYSTDGKGATQVDSRDDRDGLTYIGTLRELINNGIAEGMLEEKGIYDATIVLKMQQTAGNEYMNLSIGSDFSIQLLATQVPSENEKDSFGKDYDANAFTTVKDVAGLRTAINSAVDTTTIFLQSGDYDIDSMLVIEGKSINIVGLGVVNFKMAANQHMFTVQDSANPASKMNTTIKNVNLDGNNIAKNGFNVKYNATLNLENVTVKNTTWADVLLDNANKYNDGKFYNDTRTVVNLKNTHVDDVSMDTLPVIDTHSYKDAGVTTYAYFNYDEESSVKVIEKQGISAEADTMYINNDNKDAIGYIFPVSDDATLANALAAIKANNKYWKTDKAQNKTVTVKLAAGEYSGDHVIYQYPQWNGVIAHGSNANNYNSGVAGAPFTDLVFVGESATTYSLRAAAAAPLAKFTGNVTVNGFGNAQTGFSTATATTTFKNVGFDGANSVEENGTDKIVMYVKAAANDVTFDGCTFENATHVTLGNRASDAVGAVNVKNCTFNDGGCLAGYVETLNVENTTVNKASNGFIDKKKSGSITVNNCDVDCDIYFIRTDNTGITATINNTAVEQTDVPNPKGTGLVVFRGSGHLVSFNDCDKLDYDSIQGGAGTGVLRLDGKSLDGTWIVTDEAELAKALAEGGEVELLNDIELTETIVVPAPVATFSFRSVAPATVLNLNGKKITASITGNPAILNNGNLVVTGNGSVENTISNSIKNAGNLTVNGGKYVAGSYGINNDGGTLVINNADVQSGGGVYTWGGSVTINGGNFYSTSSGKHVVYAGNAVVELNAGLFHSNHGNNQVIFANKAEVNINGGTYSTDKGQNGSWTTAILSTTANSNVTINNAAFVGGGFLVNGGNLVVNGGTFNDIYGSKSMFYSGSAVVNGGTFIDNNTADFAKKYLGENLVAVKNNEGEYVVLPKTEGVTYTATEFAGVYAGEAKTYYVFDKTGLMNLNALFASIAPNEANIITVNLMDDVDLAGEAWAPINSMWVIFNGNNNTVSNLTAGLSADGRRSGFWTYAGAVTINDLTLENVNITGSQAGAFAGSAEGLKLNNCFLKGDNVINYVAGIEDWCGIGAITGVVQNSTMNVTIVEGATVALNRGNMITAEGCTYVDDLTGHISKNQGVVTNNGTVSATGNILVKVADGLYKNNATDANDWFVANADGLVNLNAKMADKSLGQYAIVDLIDNIDFTGKTWTPVDSQADTKFFLTELDGNGYTISNLTVNGQAMFKRFAGFGDVTVKNITFDGAYVNSGSLNSSILTVQSYQNVTLDNVDVKNSTITGSYKVAPLIATVYNESSTTVTATLIDCDVSNTTVKGSLDFMIAGMVAFVYEDDNDKVVFENCTVTDVTLISNSKGYGAMASIYCNDGSAAGSFDTADGVTVTNVTKK